MRIRNTMNLSFIFLKVDFKNNIILFELILIFTNFIIEIYYYFLKL